jgi:hypothetical protein
MKNNQALKEIAPLAVIFIVIMVSLYFLVDTPEPTQHEYRGTCGWDNIVERTLNEWCE